MATSSIPNHRPQSTTDAEFRTWGQALSTALQAGSGGQGLVKTADTGQINWTTATWPAVNNTSAGYEIYRFDDNLQGTAPVFIKFEYGRGDGQFNTIWFTIGTGTNGTGTLTTGVNARQQMNQSTTSNTPTNTSTSRICVLPGLVAIALYPGDSSSCQLLVIERDRDITGGYTTSPAGLNLAWLANQWQGNGYIMHPWTQYLSFDGSSYISPQFGQWWVGWGTQQTFGLDVAVQPMILRGKGWRNPPLSFVHYQTADIGSNAGVTIPMYGANRNYYTLGMPSANTTTMAQLAGLSWAGNTSTGNTTSFGVAIIWE